MRRPPTSRHPTAKQNTSGLSICWMNPRRPSSNFALSKAISARKWKTRKILHQPLSCCLDVDIEMGQTSFCQWRSHNQNKIQQHEKTLEKNINLSKTRTPYRTYLLVFKYHHGTLRAKSSHHHLRPSPIVQMLRPDFCDSFFFVVPLPPRWSLQPWRVLYQLTQGLNLPLMANGIGKLLELCRLLGVSFMSWFQNPPPPKKQTHTNIRSKTTLPFSHAKSRESSKQTWKGHEKTSNTFTFRSSPLLSNIFSRLDLPSCRCPALPRHCHHRWLNPTWSTKGVSAVFASRILYRTCNCVLSLRFFRKKSHTIIIHMLVSLRWH